MAYSFSYLHCGMKLKIIAFDADDTLWGNEHYFRETEQKFFDLFQNYLPQHTLARELFKTEIDNLRLYGYGIKGFVLSMIETAIRISDGKIPASAIDKVLSLGKDLLEKPVEILDGVEEVLTKLKANHKLVLATKGDLLDQHRKLHNSGLGHFFHHIEIMTEKKEVDYEKLIKRLDIRADEFMMVGNSLKSDVLPVINIGGHAVHVPFHITWEHETIDSTIEHPNFHQAERIVDILKVIESRKP
jgi:putative hydrolase of the HAD superfamily